MLWPLLLQLDVGQLTGSARRRPLTCKAKSPSSSAMLPCGPVPKSDGIKYRPFLSQITPAALNATRGTSLPGVRCLGQVQRRSSAPGPWPHSHSPPAASGSRRLNLIRRLEPPCLPTTSNHFILQCLRANNAACELVNGQPPQITMHPIPCSNSDVSTDSSCPPPAARSSPVLILNRLRYTIHQDDRRQK